MRPVTKMSNARVFSRYQQAFCDLTNQIGKYCSFCERQLDNHLAVEHKKPKSHFPNDALLWDNFLLACSSCNSVKGSKRLTLNLYFWPDKDNTFRAIIYSAAGIVSYDRSLPSQYRTRAARTIRLTGLDRYPGSKNKTPIAERDLRYVQRREAWEQAMSAKDCLLERDTDKFRKHIVNEAKFRGHFSIWMTVFHDDPDMKRRFIVAFVGTDTNCFDANGNPIARTGGQI